jgi:hypothetical protein
MNFYSLLAYFSFLVQSHTVIHDRVNAARAQRQAIFDFVLVFAGNAGQDSLDAH